MMTFLTLKMFVLQNRGDIARVDVQRHVLGADVIVVFNDQSQVNLRMQDPNEAQQLYVLLSSFIPTPKRN